MKNTITIIKSCEETRGAKKQSVNKNTKIVRKNWNFWITLDLNGKTREKLESTH